jgi:mersacidin/lichenicidin family type 2 lantibiotic
LSTAERDLTGAAGLWPALARLYALSTLDPIIEIARGLARDVAAHPHRYREVPDEVGGILAAFQTRLGTDPEWPNAAQRDEVYASLLGVPFASACAAVRGAAITFAEHGSGNETLRSVFLDAAATSSAYFKTLDGQALTTGVRRTWAVFANAIRLFRTQGVVAAFGVNAAPDGWPFDGAMDGDAAALIEVLAVALGLARSRPLISQHRFMLLQRTAFHGARTLTGLLDGDASVHQKSDFDSLMQAAYIWEKALQSLLFGLDVRRAWRNPAYRESLSRPEQSLLPPHPAGEVSIEGTELDPKLEIGLRRVGFSTLTVRSVCCCTGDLPCPFSGILALGERYARG